MRTSRAPSAAAVKREKIMNRNFKDVGWAIFMIGLGLIFLLDLDFWPWFGALIIVSSLVGDVLRHGVAGLEDSLWLIGIGLLIWQGWSIFPVILILIGLSLLLPKSYTKKNKRDDEDYEEKAKRGISLNELIAVAQSNDGELMIDDEDEPRAQRRR
jgi:hypothetical protein